MEIFFIFSQGKNITNLTVEKCRVQESICLLITTLFTFSFICTGPHLSHNFSLKVNFGAPKSAFHSFIKTD